MSAGGPGRGRRVPSPEARVRGQIEAWFLTEPLLFAVWMSHRVIENSGIAGLRSGEGRIEYNPAFIAGLPDEHLSQLLRLEATRLVLKHPYARRRPRADLMYQASNLALQEHMDTALPLPRARDVFGGRELDRQYYELYYDRLDSRAAAEPAPRQGRAGAPEAVLAQLDPARGGTENAGLWDRDELQIEEINDAIRTAQQEDRWGTMSAGLIERVLATLVPRLDYRLLLRQFRRSVICSRRELTRMKPSRRYGFDYLGSRHSFATRLLFAVDVSGSVSSADLRSAFSIVNQLFRYGIETLDVLQFDGALLGEVETFRRARRRVQVRGRGGTDFAPVLSYVEAHPGYDGAILFTDGCAPVPPAPKTRTRLFWLFNSEGSFRKMKDGLAALGQAAYVREAPLPQARRR